MSKGFTCNPEVSEDGTFIGVSIDNGHQDLNRQGLAPQGWDHDEATGQTAFYQDSIPQVDDVDASYVEALHELHPEIPQALEYLINSGVWDSERQMQHDKDIEDADLTKVSEAVEKMVQEYHHYLEMDGEHSQPNSAPVEEDEDADVPDVSSLYETEQDEDLATHFDEIAANSEGAIQLLASLSADFHANGGNPDDFIERALESNYSRQELLQAWEYFTN